VSLSAGESLQVFKQQRLPFR